MATVKKIELMHKLYGTAEGQCKDCPHFVEGRYYDKMLFKCEAYGLTHSEATDWRKKWVCCGLKDLPLPDGRTVFDTVRGQRECVAPVQCDGQIKMEI